MAADGERERLSETFNRAAQLYQPARPEYPSELYDRLLRATGLSPEARLLEIGCATGKATLPLANRGFRITCLEPGADLAAAVLEPDGHLALWGAGHVIPYDGDPFFEELQEVYDEIGESLPPDAGLPRPQELDDDRDEIEASGLFEVIEVAQYDWETVYDAEGYIDLLNTFSNHIAMHDWQRDRLYGEIRRRLAARPGGRLRRHWGGVLHVARRES